MNLDENNINFNHNNTPQDRISNYNTNKNIKIYITKSVLFLTLILLICLYNNNPNVNLNKNISPSKCLYDYGIESSEPFALKISKNETLRKTLLIISSACMDITVLIIISLWLFNGKSWSIILTIFKFYSFRLFIQLLYNMPFAKIFTFGPTGVPSIVVSYLKTNDYFYSGHVGMPIICAVEFKRHKINFVLYLCILISFYEAFVMISTGAHYLIDVLFGWIHAIYFIKITEMYTDILDNSSISINEDNDKKTDKKFQGEFFEIKNEL